LVDSRNCAISLRELGDAEKDPFRHISSYADWDVHARMPHGVQAIRKHLVEVDNVPLLVSLYTDATPSTVREVIQVFQDYGEVVLTVGSSHRLSNRDLFDVADLACGVSLLPGEHRAISSYELDTVSGLPYSSKLGLCQADLLLTFRLIRLNSPTLLQIPCPPSHVPSSIGKEDIHHHINVTAPLDFSSILEAVRVGRSFVLNSLQCLAIVCIALVILALTPVLSMISLMSLSPYIPLPMTIIFLFIYIPVIGVSVLFTRVNASDKVMKNTPRKRNVIRKMKDEYRFKSYIAARCVYVAISFVITQWIVVSSLGGDYV
jgi:hypothetical protein